MILSEHSFSIFLGACPSLPTFLLFPFPNSFETSQAQNVSSKLMHKTSNVLLVTFVMHKVPCKF